MDGADPNGATGVCSGGSPLLFWGLIALAGAGFAPCVVLPVWRDYQAMALATQVEEQLAATARADVERLRHTAAAIRTDPAVAARLARRELSYRHPGQAEVPVPGVLPAGFHAPRPMAVQPIEPPRPIARVIGRLPAMNYDRLFLDGPTRVILMLLSGGLVAAAFLLCRPEPAHPAAHVR
ncbi:MAG TPA: hypothetical protein VM243_20235 [Phycisphaerae bacterium]|nr:hypothetical protein [Phycisphaerae bacterium]